MKKALMIIGVMALLGAEVVTPANAQGWSTQPLNKSTLLTFGAPVSLPGVSLPAGTYLFRFVDPMNVEGVLQVLSKDEKTVFAMLQTIPIVRTNDKDMSEIVTFKEAPEYAPAAIDAWYFDDTLGCEVVYAPAK